MTCHHKWTNYYKSKYGVNRIRHCERCRVQESESTAFTGHIHKSNNLTIQSLNAAIALLNVPYTKSTSMFGTWGEGPPDMDAMPATTTFGELIGYRAWRLRITPPEKDYEHDCMRPAKAYLLSSAHAHVWAHGTPSPVAGVHKVAQGCGYYACKTLDHLMREVRDQNTIAASDNPFVCAEDWFIHVIGTVEMWGEVVEHTNGYRAEYMRITSLESISPTAAPYMNQLREHYLGHR